MKLNKSIFLSTLLELTVFIHRLHLCADGWNKHKILDIYKEWAEAVDGLAEAISTYNDDDSQLDLSAEAISTDYFCEEDCSCSDIFVNIRSFVKEGRDKLFGEDIQPDVNVEFDKIFELLKSTIFALKCCENKE